MNALKGKRILFISAQAFGIPEEIVSKLEEMGAHVDYYDERPANSVFVKAAIRINRNLIGHYIDEYHDSIIEKTRNNNYDYIFFIKGESFSVGQLKALFSLHPNAETIIYHWDPIANNRNALNLLPLFNKKFTFDPPDSKRYNITFLPLFYYDEYASLRNSKENLKYDFMFVGTVHSNRYRIIKGLTDKFKAQGKKCFTFFFFQSRLMFYKYWLEHKEIRNINRDSVHYSSIDKKTLLSLYESSKIIIDVNHPKQCGLTLRCMETLGSGRKLITTNRDIQNYDFYNPSNICIIDNNNPVVDKEFLDKEYIDVEENIYSKYSLSSWIKQIFA